MNSDLRDLYQEVILEHNKHPRNFRRIADANHTANGHNPLCGDKLRLYLKTRGGKIEDVSFEGEGCAISVASASLMTEAVMGMKSEDAEALFRKFQVMLTNEAPSGNGATIEEVEPGETELGKLEALAGVRDFPVRVKCATLAWHALHAALEGKQEVTTE